MKKRCILITGALGQVGTELTEALGLKYRSDQIIASDRHIAPDQLRFAGQYEQLDVMDKQAITALVRKYQITEIYHLAAMLSASGELKPQTAWNLNMQSLLNILEISVEEKIVKVFWPSSIAVFGPTSPKSDCGQYTTIEPATIYGISKQAGEQWCNYYFRKYGLDVRSLRYPGLISYKALPGGGTTDYAIDMFIESLNKGYYNCFLRGNTCLPMMYMPDAILATLQLIEAPKENISVRTAYNLSAMSFSPEELAREIKDHLPHFQLSYQIDFRQEIADNWPQSIDDIYARKDWAWKPEYDLKKMVGDMLFHLKSIRAESKNLALDEIR